MLYLVSLGFFNCTVPGTAVRVLVLLYNRARGSGEGEAGAGSSENVRFAIVLGSTVIELKRPMKGVSFRRAGHAALLTGTRPFAVAARPLPFCLPLAPTLPSVGPIDAKLPV
jgi:hypothetical protein